MFRIRQWRERKRKLAETEVLAARVVDNAKSAAEVFMSAEASPAFEHGLETFYRRVALSKSEGVSGLRRELLAFLTWLCEARKGFFARAQQEAGSVGSEYSVITECFEKIVYGRLVAVAQEKAHKSLHHVAVEGADMELTEEPLTEDDHAIVERLDELLVSDLPTTVEKGM